MNLERFIIDGGLADTEPAAIAVSYITEVLDLPDADDQLASLEPLVRPAASRVASKIRRAQRSGPAQPPHGSQSSHGGPAPKSSKSQAANDAPAWARANADLIAYCRDHQSDHYWIPGSGRRKLIEITRDEWLARARWLTQQAQGALKSAGFSRAFADLIQAAGGETVADVLEVAA